MTPRAARREDLPAIARVHDAAFAGFFLSEMGPPFVRAYYELVLAYDGGLVLAADVDGALRGFVAGFGDPASFYAYMSDRRSRLILPVVRGVLRRPGLLPRVLFNRRRVSAEAAGPSRADHFVLSSIGVDPAAAGRGLGRELVAAFVAGAGERGGRTVSLTTDADDNEAVNAFYPKCGFALHRTFASGPGRRMNEYLLKI
jgi:ribosomal protein S18 acetylase RimI-like enzyme